MKSTSTLIFGLLILGSAIHGANWCTHMFCKDCTYAIGTSTEHKSCLDCARGVYTAVSDGSAVGFECKESKTIPNCKGDFKNKDSLVITCQECEEGYYSNTEGTACVAVATKIENCIEYSSLGTKCSTCKEGYYRGPEGTACVKNPELANCTSFSLSAGVVVCSTCDKDYIRNVAGTTCTKVTTPIANCERYSSSDTPTTPLCSSCKHDFLRADATGTSCVSEPKGCSTLTEVVCKCRDSYYAVDYLGPAAGNKCQYFSRILSFFSVITVALMSIWSH